MSLSKEVENRNFFTTTSKKSIQDFIKRIRENASRFNFGVRHVFDMRENTETKMLMWMMTFCCIRSWYVVMENLMSL